HRDKTPGKAQWPIRRPRQQLAGGVQRSEPSVRTGAAGGTGDAGEGDLHVLWEDPERVLCRRSCRDADGSDRTVLAVLPATEHPSAATLDRLAHEYGLRDDLQAAGAVRPLEL